ncbi:MAG: hypothetical protein LBM01_00585 [Christensenellaceae bacterium]|jgi:uncharacterized membrane protein YkvI|nr:hypothetical protein [Christensenellaceae bacterium]
MWGIAFLFVGSIIGAGFATGAEILAFFGGLDFPPLLIGAFVVLTQFAVMFLILNRASKQTQKSTRFTKFKKVYELALYFILFTAMTAGISKLFGAIAGAISLCVSLFIVFLGFNKMVVINRYLVLFVSTVLFIINIVFLNSGSFEIGNAVSAPSAIFWAFLYSGLNCCMMDSIVKTALKTKTRREVILASIISSLIVGVFTFLILNSIRTNAISSAVPMLEISKNPITLVAVLGCIITSQFSSLFSIKETLPARFSGVYFVALVCALCFAMSFIGFSNIISFFYPIIGGITVITLSIFYIRNYSDNAIEPK